MCSVKDMPMSTYLCRLTQVSYATMILFGVESLVVFRVQFCSKAAKSRAEMARAAEKYESRCTSALREEQLRAAGMQRTRSWSCCRTSCRSC